MKKKLIIAITFSLVLSGLGAVGINVETERYYEKMHYNFTEMDFSSINVIENDEEISFSFADEELYLLNPGQPMIPKVVKKYELPFGATNINVELNPKEIIEMEISKEIKPVPSPMPKTPFEGFKPYPRKDSSIYDSAELFPKSWYSYNVGVGLNKNGDHVTHLTVHVFPFRYSPLLNKLSIANNADISISYDEPDDNIFPAISEYDLVIIAPSKFQSNLEPFIEHKTNHGISTVLKTTEDIYKEFDGVDKAEKIKYFIKDALETWDMKYVLLVGGLKSKIYAKGRDNENIGEKNWHVPARFSNLDFGDPGYACDLYYADIYKEGGEFDEWDSNGNGIFAEWIEDRDGNIELLDVIDLYPDVAVGRLACRDTKEVDDVVNKIIKYETTTYGKDWFESILVISGDGFLDQHDLNIRWDTKEVPDGDYSIHAQSFNPENDVGPIDTINIVKDSTVESDITFNHDDHLNPALENGYPAPPIAEIVSVSEGNILGNTDISFRPRGGAYCNDLFWWANVSYVDGVLTIRGKSYDPKPYGNITNIHVWVENSDGEIVFSDWRNNTKTYYEGEWVTGAKAVLGRGGALYYMPDNFKKDISWTSNGEYSNQQDVMDAFSRGYGFAFFSGHGSPGFWGDHTPGIPGDRAHSQLTGLVVSQLRLYPQFPFIFYNTPIFPMEELTNNDKLPLTVVGGCYNAQFTVSMVPTALEYILISLGIYTYMHTYGTVVPECWCWYMVKMPNTGSIATIGNTGTGWGWEGEYCTIGAGDGWISSEFFRQYGENGYDILGDNYLQTQTEYISQFREFTLPECWWYPDLGWDIIDEKTVQQWVLLGDPSLKIGGYQ
ncbi:MAG: peptidase C25 [Thermoplasmatales archaeon]|nr:MAG: peptidase C25 [Thermoplasmatales archaeon]